MDIKEDLQDPGRRPRGWAIWVKGIATGLLVASLAFGIVRVSWSVRLLLGRARPASRTESHLIGGQADIHHAMRFTLEYRDDCKIIRINQPWNGARQGFIYQLVPRGTRPACPEPGAVLVEIPVKRFVLLNSTLLPAFEALGRVDAVLGIAASRFVSTKIFAERLASGDIQEVADGVSGMQRHLNYDRLFTLAPELILASGSGDPSIDQHDKLGEAGFKVAICADYMEQTPLGRAEWIKFVAAFLDRDAEAERLFAGVEARYEAQRALTQNIRKRPTVVCGLDYRGSWYAPGGGSYVAAYLRDAGANYFLEEDPSPGARALKIETVLDKGRDADFWMLHMTGSSLKGLRDLQAIDPRYNLFQAFRAGRVFNTNGRVNAGGGNDYWEGGAAHPDVVLADLIHIFHPELNPGHALRYHAWLEPLPARKS